MALIKAAIIELHEKRLRAFRCAAETDQHDPATLVRTYWRQLQKPAFIAFHELALAARTHADLARILQPLQVEFRERYMAMAFSLFPEWADRDQFNLAMTLSQTVLEGLAISVQTGAADEARSEERRVGKECVSTCRVRWSTYHSKKKQHQKISHTR